MNAITFPHNSTLNQKIPNTPLVISEIPDGNQILSALCMEDWCNKCLSSMAVWCPSSCKIGRAVPGAQVTGHSSRTTSSFQPASLGSIPGWTFSCLSMKSRIWVSLFLPSVSVHLALEWHGATLIRVCVKSSTHIVCHGQDSSLLTSANPATGTPDQCFFSELFERSTRGIRERPILTSSNQNMIYKTKHPSPAVSRPFCSSELHFINNILSNVYFST